MNKKEAPKTPPDILDITKPLEELFDNFTKNTNSAFDELSRNTDELFDNFNHNVDEFFKNVDFSQVPPSPAPQRQTATTEAPRARRRVNPNVKEEIRKQRLSEAEFYRLLEDYPEYRQSIERVRSSAADANELRFLATHFEKEAAQLRQEFDNMPTSTDRVVLEQIHNKQIVAAEIVKQAKQKLQNN